MPADSAWTPLGLTADEFDSYSTLREDVPPWLAATLTSWIGEQFTRDADTMYPGFDVALARTCERVLRIPIADHGEYNLESGVQAVLDSYGNNPLLTWRLVDYLLSRPGTGQAARLLNDALFQAGSAWTVGARNDRVGLLKRLPDGVAAAASQAFTHDDSGRLLMRAWQEVYSVSPDPSNGYRLAIKAVEDAVFAVVCPNDSSATLGKALGNLEKGTWQLPHVREDPRATSHDVLVSMLRLIWVGQHDRHGAQSVVTQAEAESTIQLAVAIVGLFSTGQVRQ